MALLPGVTVAGPDIDTIRSPTTFVMAVEVEAELLPETGSEVVADTVDVETIGSGVV